MQTLGSKVASAGLAGADFFRLDRFAGFGFPGVQTIAQQARRRG
jgi:hypothetical protein